MQHRKAKRLWYDLIKKALRKFEWMSLRNEINAVKAGSCMWLVSHTVVWI